MRAVFADTSFFIAILNRKDQLHLLAIDLRKRLRPFLMVTSEMVLVELLNDISRRDEAYRHSGLRFVEGLRTGTQSNPPGVIIIPQTHDQFVEACTVYAQHGDKGWSLTDCASFVVMRAQRITEALTQDKHFEQMGFKALLRADA